MKRRGRRATSKDVSELAGVSRTTVSFVLNNVEDVHISPETRRRVLEAARELNYYPNAAARSLVRQQAGVIGLIISQNSEHIVADPFLPGLILGLGAATREHGFHFLIHPLDNSSQPTTYDDLIHTRRIDGAIISGPRSDDENLRQLLNNDFPIVLHGRLENVETYCVDVDNVRGMQNATEHLIKLGHRRIALITNAPPAFMSSADRHTGYRLALETAGIPYDDGLVRYGQFSADSGHKAMQDILDAGNPPDAACVASDLVAMGAMQAIRERGLRVPDDVAVVGFDDVPLAAYMVPPLTTVRLPTYDLGWNLGDMLIRLIQDDTPGEKVVLLETELVVRESCGAVEPAH